MSHIHAHCRRVLDRLTAVSGPGYSRRQQRRIFLSIQCVRNMCNKRVLPPRIKYELTGVERLSHKPPGWTEWWSTETGRQTARTVSILAGSIFVGACWIREVIATSYIQRCYSEDLEGANRVKFLDWFTEGEDSDKMPPSPELVRLYSKLGRRAELDEVQHEKIEVFTSALLDPVVIGTTHSKQGASVGFPRHMMWRSEEEVDLQNIYIKPYWNPFFKGYKIPADTDPGDLKLLKQTFLLSDNAREFIVSKCMKECNQFSPWFRAFFPGVIFAAHYVLGRRMNNQLELFKQPRYMRYGIQSLLGVCMITMGIAALNQLEYLQEAVTLEGVVQSTEEAQAAIEFYKKLIERNKLLRKILGPESKYYFTEDGNVVPSPHIFPEVADLNNRLKNAEYLFKKFSDIERRRRELELQSKSR